MNIFPARCAGTKRFPVGCLCLFNGKGTRMVTAHWTTLMGGLTSHPAAFLVVLIYGAGWYVFERNTFDWHAVATLIVWTMTLFIKRADRRDTLAIHAKLDELLRVDRAARTELAQIDEEEPEQIERVRDRERRDATAAPFSEPGRSILRQGT